ncbi:hypothetical protein D9M72_528110 [compost metagenome]
MVALRQRVEQRLDPHGQNEDTKQLDHGDHPENPVIRVVRAGEPGEVDPCPDDGKHREREPQQPGTEVGPGDLVGELASGHAERNHEGEVEKQLQRSGCPVLLMRVAAAHAGHGMPEGVGRHGSKITAGSGLSRSKHKPDVGEVEDAAEGAEAQDER